MGSCTARGGQAPRGRGRTAYTLQHLLGGWYMARLDVVRAVFETFCSWALSDGAGIDAFVAHIYRAACPPLAEEEGRAERRHLQLYDSRHIAADGRSGEGRRRTRRVAHGTIYATRDAGFWASLLNALAHTTHASGMFGRPRLPPLPSITARLPSSALLIQFRLTCARATPTFPVRFPVPS